MKMFANAKSLAKRAAERPRGRVICEGCGGRQSKRRRKCSFCLCLVGACCMRKREEVCSGCREIKAQIEEVK